MENNYTIGIPQDKPYYRTAFILIHLIDSAIMKVRLQQSRIEAEKNSSGKMLELFADIHFLLISLGNLRRLLQEMSNILSSDTDYMEIANKYLPSLDKIGLVRNHLEHILDGRLEGKGHRGKPLTEPNMFGNLFGDEYNFGGDKFNLKDAEKMITDLENELKEWNKVSQVYPFW